MIGIGLHHDCTVTLCSQLTETHLIFDRRIGLRAAALLALGRSPRPVVRGVLVGRLESDERDLRLAALIDAAASVRLTHTKV